MENIHGYSGQTLIVDLSSGRIEKSALDERDIRQYLGGTGFGTKYAYEMTEPGTDPLSPENVLVYSAGPLVGTMVPGAARTVVTAKSPMTGLFGTSAAGHFGTMMRFAGYDNIVITGKATKPVYLKIFDDKVTIEDASHIWGKDIYETTEIIWQDYPKAWVSCIGPAGENLVPYAVIINNKYSTYGTTGLGAVMGSKNLKALVAYGSGKLSVAQPQKFMKLADKAYKELMSAPYVLQWRELGTLIQYQDFAPGATDKMRREGIDIKNWTEIYSKKLRQRPITCPSCPVGCKADTGVGEGKYRGARIPMSCPAGTLTLPFVGFFGLPLDRFDEIARCAELSNRYGLSTQEFPAMFGFAARLFEEGILTKADTGGLEIKWGEPSVVHELMRLVTYRQGFGDVLAGRYEDVCKRIGKGAEQYIAHMKGLIDGIERGIVGEGVKRWIHPHAGVVTMPIRWTTTTFGNLISPRGPQPNPYSSISMMPKRSGESLRRYAERIGVPQGEIDQIITGEVDGFNVPALTLCVEIYNLILYSLGSCQRPFISRVLDIDTCAELYSALTGIETTAHDLFTIGERIINLQRLFNLREGLTRADDIYPVGYLLPAQQEEIEAMVSEYYQRHGWDRDTGIPTPEKLAELGLGHILSTDASSKPG